MLPYTNPSIAQQSNEGKVCRMSKTLIASKAVLKGRRNLDAI